MLEAGNWDHHSLASSFKFPVSLLRQPWPPLLWFPDGANRPISPGRADCR